MAYQNPLSINATPTHDGPKRSELTRGKILAFVPEPLFDTGEAAAVMKIHPKTSKTWRGGEVSTAFALAFPRIAHSRLDRPTISHAK